jgi:hypothetical protein
VSSSTSDKTSETSVSRVLFRDAALCSLALFGVAFSHLVAGKLTIPSGLGFGVVWVIVMLGLVCARIIPSRLPDLFWVSAAAVILTWPGVPGANWMSKQIDHLDPLATMPPLMAFAALGLSSNELNLFKTAGLRFAIITLLVLIGTFVSSLVVAEIALQFDASSLRKEREVPGE